MAMANVLNEEKKQQVLALGRLGWSLRRIQQATGVRRETASMYLKAAGIAVRPAGAWGRGSALPVSPKISTQADAGQRVFGLASDASPSNPANELITDSGAAKPANEVITDFGARKPAGEAILTDPELPKPADGVITGSGLFRAAAEIPATSDGLAHLQPQAESGSCPTRCPSASACEPYRELIEIGLGRGRNTMAIWQDLVSDSAFNSGYQSVRRFVRKLQRPQAPQARAVILTAPGEEAQVDYGCGPMVRDPHTGKYRRTRLFVLTLGYSRKSVRFLAFRSSSRLWAHLSKPQSVKWSSRDLGSC